MPPHILNPLLSVFRELVTSYGVSFVFSTATQPAFRRSGELTEGLSNGELKPILSRDLTTQLFHDLRRVQYHIDRARPWSWDELVERLVETPQALCVLNTRANARTVWEVLREKVREKRGEHPAKGVIHLSSAMCAQHRLDILGAKDSFLPGSVRDRLSRGRPCWLVSTQVIEAGVDVDFPRVFRATGPLDAIVQVAGRCNREGELKDPVTGKKRYGDVVVFQPTEGGMPKGFYQRATGEAWTLLGELTEEQLATDHTLFAKYFTTLYARTSTDAAPKGEKPIQQLRADFMFRSVADRAKVIDDGGTSVFVPYGKAEAIIHKMQEARFFDYRGLRRLQRFTVNLRPNDLHALQTDGLVNALLPGQEDGPLVLHASAYNRDLGVVIAGRPAEDFIQ